ncbi:hypothetical protein ABBQ38_012078 [Trebouxia sp. C0009 RCD-2024]
MWTAAGVFTTLTLASVAAFIVWRVAQWFNETDADSHFSASQHFLEDPSSFDKVPPPSIFSEATKSLSVIIPAYNEEDRLPVTLEDLIGYLRHRRDKQGANFTYEIIIVDDGSEDSTSEVAFDYVRKHGFETVRVIRLARNMGKGRAVKAGMMIARGEHLLMADADDATKISDLAKLEDALKQLTTPGTSPTTRMLQQKSGLGMAIGSRAHMQEQAVNRRSWHRNMLMRGFHILVMMVIGDSVKDTQCGFKLFTRRAARSLYKNQRIKRWCFDVELIYLAQELHIPIAEVPVQWREVPGSKIRLTSMISMAVELLAVLLGYKVFGQWTIKSEAEA